MATIGNTTEAARRAVWAMLTEDSGVHWMDSGGANGRAWQRNRAKGYDAACAERAAWVDGYPARTWTSPSGGVPQTYPAYYSVTVSALHFLAERVAPVSADHPAAVLLRTVEDENPEESWLGVQDFYREAIEDAGAGPTNIHNSYEWENLLSQTWQAFTFSADGSNGEPDVPMLCICSHNGADVRGGYSRPYLFHLPYYGSDADYAESCLCAETQHAEIYCTASGCADHDPDYGYAYGFHMYGPDRIGRAGDLIDDAADWGTLTCPQCGTVDSLRADMTEPCG